jgi:hypothetical protein
VKWLLILTLLTCSGCYHLKERSTALAEPRETIKLPFLDSVFISNTALASRISVNAFYKSHQYSLLWSDTSGLRPVADTLLNIVRSSAAYGLIPDDYHLSQIDSLLGAEPTDRKAITLDAFLTDNFFTLRHHLKYGRLDSAHVARKTTIDVLDSTGVLTLSTREGQMMLRTAI